MYCNEFCDQFAQWRKAKRISLIKISKAIRVPVSTLAAWLLGYNPLPPDMKTVLEQFMKEYGE